MAAWAEPLRFGDSDLVAGAAGNPHSDWDVAIVGNTLRDAKPNLVHSGLAGRAKGKIRAHARSENFDLDISRSHSTQTCAPEGEETTGENRSCELVADGRVRACFVPGFGKETHTGG